jgi:hypothetical protein
VEKEGKVLYTVLPTSIKVFSLRKKVLQSGKLLSDLLRPTAA